MKILNGNIRKFINNPYSNKKNFSFQSVSILNPIAFKESRINKNAMIINTQHFQSKIVFPDYKFDLNLKMENDNYTIKDLLEDSKKGYERDNILNIAFLDEDGNQIANSTKASMLLRLNQFIISFNWGDRIYNCVNPNFLGNNQLDKQVVPGEANINFDKLNKLVFTNNISFNTAIELAKTESKIKPQQKKIKYSSILKDYLKTKYTVINQFYDSIKERRERRVQKIINTFFYASLIQVVTLNLCTFVFISWDFMEPITTCITYLNILCGYYYWAMTETDYEIEAMIYWIKNIDPIFNRSIVNSMLQEKEEIDALIKEDKYKF